MSPEPKIAREHGGPWPGSMPEISDEMVTRVARAAEERVHCDHLVCWARGITEEAVRDLGASGRLLPDPVETDTRWEVEWNWPDSDTDRHEFDDEQYQPALRDLALLRAENVRSRSRTVRTYEDGSILTGPWVPVPEEGTAP